MALFAGDRIPNGTTVVGVDVGGLSADAAERRLAKDLGPRAENAMLATVDGAEVEIDPKEAGLTFDIAGTVDAVHGSFSLNPARLITVVFGGQEAEPRIRVDEAALAEAVDRLAAEIDRDPSNGRVEFVDGEAEVTPPETGVVLNRAQARQRIRDGYLVADAPVKLPTEEVSPAVDDAEIDRAMTDFVEPALSGPVTVNVGDESFEVTPRQIASALSMAPVDGGTLVPELGPKRLAKALKDELAEIGSEPEDATIRMESGEPVVVPAKMGRVVDPKQLSEALLAVLPQTGDARTVELQAQEKEADRTTKELEELGVTEVVGEFTTTFPHAEYRNTNIGRAASLINGTLLEPGDVFSLNGLVGERTRANGFTEGGVIVGGRLVEALGGGVSQLATTTYNAAFYAGMEDIEHRPHAFYISRYPAGREATVYWGSIDLRFGNNTPYGVYVEARVDPSTPGTEGVVTVRLWSTKHWEVEEEASERYNHREPETIYDPSDDCIPQGGSPGFDIDITRRLYRDGELVETETDHWPYRAEDEIICGPDPSEDNDQGNGDGGDNDGGGDGGNDGGGGNAD